ncbi:MAG: DUF3822 family protein [Flavobacteriales bacterium]
MTAEHRSPAYDPVRERAWHLSLWVAPEVSGWCVHERASGEVVALFTGKGDALPHGSAMPLRPSSVSFAVLPEISTLVPESALVPGSEMRHLKMVHGTLPTGLLRDEPIGALGARCVYLHDERTEHQLLARFPHARSLPLQAVLVQGALARSGGGPVVVAHRTERRLDLAIARDKRLLLSNTFHAVTEEDLLYYTLFAIERCGLRPENVALRTGGPLLTDAEEALLARYVPDTAPMLDRADSRFHGLGPLPGRIHRWAALIDQFACAS